MSNAAVSTAHPSFLVGVIKLKTSDIDPAWFALWQWWAGCCPGLDIQIDLECCPGLLRSAPM
jgi:hypothetical protein